MNATARPDHGGGAASALLGTAAAAYVAALLATVVTHGDMYLANAGVLPAEPTTFYALAVAPLLVALGIADLLRGRGTAAPREIAPPQAGLYALNAPVLLPFACLALYHLLPGALWPDAAWRGDGGAHLLLPLYALFVAASAMAVASFGFFRRRWRLYLLACWLVTLGTVLYEVHHPGYFAGTLDPSVRWATETERPTGWVGDPNTAAFILLMLCALLLNYRTPGPFNLLVLLGTSAGVVATLSRGGLVLFAVLVVAYLVQAWRAAGAGRVLGHATLMLAIGVAGIASALPLLGELPFASSFEGEQRLKALSLESAIVDGGDARIALVRHYLDLIEGAAVLGHGSGFGGGLESGAHNMYLAFWAENGLAGAALYVWLLLGALVMFARRRFHGGVALVAIVAVHSLFSHTVLESRAFPILLGVASTISLLPPPPWPARRRRYARPPVPAAPPPPALNRGAGVNGPFTGPGDSPHGSPDP